MAVDLMVTTFVGGAVTVTSVPQLSSVTGANVALAVCVGAASGVLCAEHAASARTATAVRRTGRVLGIGMRAPGARQGGGRASTSLVRGGVGCTSHLRRAAHVRAARPGHNRSGSAHRVGLVGGRSASGARLVRAGQGALVGRRWQRRRHGDQPGGSGSAPWQAPSQGGLPSAQEGGRVERMFDGS